MSGVDPQCVQHEIHRVAHRTELEACAAREVEQVGIVRRERQAAQRARQRIAMESRLERRARPGREEARRVGIGRRVESGNEPAQLDERTLERERDDRIEIAIRIGRHTVRQVDQHRADLGQARMRRVGHGTPLRRSNSLGRAGGARLEAGIGRGARGLNAELRCYTAAP
jgi:hypothetical protein